MPITTGIDIGSLTTKCAFYDGEKMIGYFISRSGHEFERIGGEVYEKALSQCNLNKGDINFIMGTGYGRYSIPFADGTITEISAHARGVNFLLGDNVRTIIDIGGQDSKGISVGKNGKVLDFVMNDKCAAGTGRFIEVMANALKVGHISEMGPISLKSKKPSNISSMCTVFAESEIISLFASGIQKEDIISGIHKAIVKRIVGMVKRIKIQPTLAFCGGVAKNVGVRKAIKDELKMDVLVPDEPQIPGALGAAIIAYEKLEKS